MSGWLIGRSNDDLTLSILYPSQSVAGDEFNDIIDDHPDGSTFDAGLSDGVLTLKLGQHGT